jgi:hypothetical protein
MPLPNAENVHDCSVLVCHIKPSAGQVALRLIMKKFPRDLSCLLNCSS